MGKVKIVKINKGPPKEACVSKQKPIFSEEEYHERMLMQTYSAIMGRDHKMKDHFFGNPLIGYLIKTSNTNTLQNDSSQFYRIKRSQTSQKNDTSGTSQKETWMHTQENYSGTQEKEKDNLSAFGSRTNKDNIGESQYNIWKSARKTQEELRKIKNKDAKQDDRQSSR